MKFEAAIFDLDGTLIDSAGIWDEIDKKFLGRRGLDVPEDYAAAIACYTLREAAEYTAERFSLNEDTDGIIAEWQQMAAEEYSRLRFKKGASELLKTLKANGVKLALATSADRELCQAVLKANGAQPLFDSCIYTDMTGRSKEYPDVYIYAAGALGCGVRQCVVIEDTAAASAAAQSAGFKVIKAGDGEFPAGEILGIFK